MWRWLIVAVAAYEGIVGIAELSTLFASTSLANTVVGWPSLGWTIYGYASAGSVGSLAGTIDVGAAAFLLLIAGVI